MTALCQHRSSAPPLPRSFLPLQLMGAHADEFIRLEDSKSAASLDAKLEAAAVRY